MFFIERKSTTTVVWEKMKKMKIAMLTPDYYPKFYAGVGVHVYNLVQYLKKDFDVEITVFVLRCEVNIAEQPQIFMAPDGVNVIEFTGEEKIPHEELDYFTYKWTRNNIIALNYLADHLKEYNFDIIHCHDLFPVWLMDMLRRKLNIPVVSSIHARSADELKIEDSLRGFLCRKSDACIAVSGKLKEELEDRYKTSGIRVIYNGVTASDSIKITQKQNYLTYCGRVFATKGIDILLQAFARVVEDEKYQLYRLKIMGTGELLEKLKQLAIDLKIDSNVDFMGYVDNKDARKVISNAKIHIVPSTYEPFATSALEAMEENTAVIASKVGGLQEMIVNQKTGILVEPSNIEQLSNAIKELLNDDEYRADLEEQATKYVKQFEWPNIAKQVYDLYNEVLEAYSK